MNPDLPNKTFLSDGNTTFSYADLFGFARAFKQQIRTEPPLVMIPGVPEPDIILTIASCYLLDQPAMIFRPDQPEIIEKYASMGSLLIQPEATSYRNQFIKDNVRVIKPDTLDRSVDYLPPTPVNNNRKAVLTLFTSGTTGQPKPIHISRCQLDAAISNAARNFKPAPDESWLLCLPIFHMGGLGVIYRSVSYGSGIYLSPEFDAEQCADILNSNPEVRYASLVPTQLKRMIPHIYPDQHHLKAVLIGGGPIPATLLKMAKEKSIPAIGSYGMTETCGQIFAQPLNSKAPSPPGSAGKLFGGNRVQIRDIQTNKILPPDETGSIYLQGNQIPDFMMNQHLSDRFDSEGWFETADIGSIDEHGNLFVEGRRDDVILTGGENVIPYQVEEALATVDGIGDTAVIGLPDEEWGQRVVAVYTGKLPDDSTLYARLREHLPAYAIPKSWFHVDELPKNDMGKLERSRLRERISNQFKAGAK